MSLIVGSLSSDFQRAEAEGLVEHLVDEPLALDAVEQRVFGVAQVLDDQADVAAQGVAVQVADARQVELLDQLAVDVPLQLLEALVAAAGAAHARAGQPATCRWSPPWLLRLLSFEIPCCKRDMVLSLS